MGQCGLTLQLMQGLLPHPRFQTILLASSPYKQLSPPTRKSRLISESLLVLTGDRGRLGEALLEMKLALRHLEEHFINNHND